YFHEHWLKNDNITAKRIHGLESTNLLDRLFEGSTINYHLEGNHVILVNNTHIITLPSISTVVYNEGVVESAIDEVGFAREKKPVSNNPEEIVFTIGNIKKYQKGGTSTIAGYLKEVGTDNPVEDAFVYTQNPTIGTSSDASGFFAITLPNGKQTLFFQSVNLINTYRQLMLFSDGKLDVEMEQDVIALNAVNIHAEREVNVKSTQMGVEKIDMKKMKIIPALLGERDLVKVATSTAGVQNVGEGAAGVNIRGGKADQNLFLFDGSPVYNTNHFFGFFSVFNSDAISEMQLYKSAMPAEYGGRLSSVFDIRTKEPNAEKFAVSGGISPITSKLMIEGPLFKKGPSFLVGGRATYSDFVLSKIKNSPLKNNNASFYDVVGKLHYPINDKNEVSLSGYYSYDGFQLSSDTLLSYTDFSYSNQLLSFNWKHVFNKKLLGHLQFGSSDYQYGIGYDVLPSQAFTIDFGVKELRFAAKFDYFINEKVNYKFGVEAKQINVNPGNKIPSGAQSLITPDGIDDEKGLDIAPYFSATYSPSAKLSIDAGIRYSIYSVLGPSSVHEYASNAPKDPAFITNTISYGKNEPIKTYHGPEFRLSSRYSLNETSSLKAGYSRTRQNVHLLINSASISPTDIWRLSSKYIKPQIADQLSVGYYKNFYGKHTIETSAEVYYKHIQNLLDIKVGADLQFNQHVETDILQGKGRSYGIEFSAKKSSGWLTGWINYTYSRSLIQLNGNYPDEIINGGNYFPTGYDKPHYINSVTNYKFTRRLTMTLNLVYATGIPVTYPVGKWSFKSSENLLYSDRNAFRIPDYFRMDLGVNIEGSHKIKKLAHSSWTISVYNLLGRDNIYSVFFKVEEGIVKGYKMTVFSSPIPTITYNFIF
ncbi:MAG: TonB-dependent receptor, partial [Cyclobacteriaceae bacterium]|nr:TonB-dependent receptor [Cyclobacteriaceae bacterium]